MTVDPLVDIESQPAPLTKTLDNESSGPSPTQGAGHGPDSDSSSFGIDKVAEIRQRSSILRILANFEKRLDKLNSFEAQGVERVPDDARKPPQLLNMMLIWFSVLLNATFIPIGMLGPIFGLSVHTSVILTVFAVLTGTTMPAFTGTLSPQTGLRQIALARYSMGRWGSAICAILNVVINVGYATVAAIVGGQLLRAVSGGSMSLVVGILVVVVATFVISFFGYGLIHHYHRYAWCLAFVLLCALWGQARPHFTSTPGVSLASGIDYSGACLSYFAIIFGVCCSWCPIAGDYYIHYPVHTSKWVVFGLTYAGIALPSLFVCILGNYFGGIIAAHADLQAIYLDGGVGALILEIMTPPAWGKLASVLFVLTFLADCTCNVYSSALSIQLLGSYFMAVPRFFWCTLISLVAFALAYGGRNVLQSILENLLSILGYWTLAFAEILFIEHFVFRPRLGGYDLSAWQDTKRLPVGIAGTAALLIGIGFSFLGMSQTWYVAPIAKRIGAYGGDVGDELVLVSVAIAFPILRHFEIKHFGR